MKIFRKASELEPNLVSIKDKGQSIGLVLTMGNLHDGHLSLIREAQLHNEFVICSIFINPTQFNNENDFNSYPKTFEFNIASIGVCSIPDSTSIDVYNSVKISVNSDSILSI